MKFVSFGKFDLLANLIFNSLPNVLASNFKLDSLALKALKNHKKTVNTNIYHYFQNLCEFGDCVSNLYLTLMKMVVTGKKSGGVVGMNTVGVKVLVKNTGGVMEP